MKRTIRSFLLFSTLALALGTRAEDALVIGETEQGATSPPSAPASELVGSQKALLIGIDQYRHFASLPNCVFDCQAIATELRDRYGFSEVVEIYNDQATREGILKTLRLTAAGMGEDDSLMIYFSGHGIYDDFLDEGYRVPVEGSSDVTTCIPSTEIQSYVKATRARHVWVVCDSCFSGSLFREKSAASPRDLLALDRYVREMIGRKSRLVLSAGGNEPVTANGYDGHSMFAYYFLRALRSTARGWTDSSQIFDQIKIDLTNNTEQTPQQGVIFGAGHDRGEFFLFEKGAAGADRTQAENPPMTSSNPESSTVVLPDSQPIEEPPAPSGAVVPVPDQGPTAMLPGEVPLELIQVGEAGIWMGRTEVTQNQWAAVASLPKVRKDLSMDPSRVKGGDHPVENVSLADCNEFCQRLFAHTGSFYRLPTEAEWMRACAGADPKGANVADLDYGQLTGIGGAPVADWHDSFAETAPVGSFPPNALGFLDMAGNVAEWCLSGDGPQRVYRGGSWGHSPKEAGCEAREAVTAKTRPSGFVGFRVVRETAP
jgi:uncharacterized caspase-like protein